MNFFDLLGSIPGFLDRFSLVIIGGLMAISIITLLWPKLVTPEQTSRREKARVNKQLEKLKRKANAILKAKYSDPMRFILSFCYLAFSIAVAFGIFYLLVICKGF